MQAALMSSPQYTDAIDTAYQGIHPLGPQDNLLSAMEQHPDITNNWVGLLVAVLGLTGTLVTGGLGATAVLSATIAFATKELESKSDEKYGDFHTIHVPQGAAYWLPSKSNPKV